MSAQVESEVLDVWRDGERLLAELSPVHPDHETVRLLIADLSVLRQRIRDSTRMGASAVRSSRRTVAEARAVIDATRAQLRRPRRPLRIVEEWRNAAEPTRFDVLVEAPPGDLPDLGDQFDLPNVGPVELIELWVGHPADRERSRARMSVRRTQSGTITRPATRSVRFV